MLLTKPRILTVVGQYEADILLWFISVTEYSRWSGSHWSNIS